MREFDIKSTGIHSSVFMDQDNFTDVSRKREPIAITGIGCRFPGNANNPDAFWRLLKDGTDAIGLIPEDRWSINEFYHPEPQVPGMSFSKWGGFIEDIDKFEPECFGISPREAVNIDPQQRILLETAWEALEDAGYIMDDLAGSDTGVFVGISTSDYQRLQFGPENRRVINAHMGTGSAFSVAANRISYCFNFNGPSMAVDTACSSSLFSTHLACMSIWKGECEMALSGGVNVIISPENYIGFSQMSMLSPDGRCKAFDHRANGFVRSEGAGMVTLKPLSRAVSDRDKIYALICATGVNHSGRTSGITVPSKTAQKSLLNKMYSNDGVKAEQIYYVEAHGTGTIIGDPIEANAIGEVVARKRKPPVRIGSVKTNIGHLEAAAGIAGLIKTALMLKNKTIVPSLHFQKPNPKIDLDALNIKITTHLEAMPENDGPVYAGVNSFGFGGANAHVVLSSCPAKTSAIKKATTEKPPGPYSLVMSARSSDALKMLARSYQDFLRQDDSDTESSLEDICYTASMHRTFFDHRLSLTRYNKEEMIQGIQAFLKGKPAKGLHVNRKVGARDLKLVFVFSGQGPQWHAMGRQLMEKEPVFADTIKACNRFLSAHCDWSLIEELSRDENNSNIHRTAITQPALFAVQAGLFNLFKSYHIIPDAVIGHSIGEVAAAYAAGIFSLKEAVKIIFFRGSTMDRASSRGKMLAVALPAHKVEAFTGSYKGKISIAAVNSPSMVTLSGDADVLDDLAPYFKEQRIFHRFLKVDYAFHSHKMEPVKTDLLTNLKGLQPGQAAIPMLSTVTGNWIEGDDLTGEYWWNNVRSRVGFADGITKLIQEQHNIFLEISPHPVLANSIKECMIHENLKNGFIFPTLRRGEDEHLSVLSSLGGLYTLGYPIDFKSVWPEKRMPVRLPSYPWRKQQFWLESEASRAARMGHGSHPMMKPNPTASDPSWLLEADPARFPWLKDHTIRNQVVFPATAYIEMALSAAGSMFKDTGIVLEEVDFLNMMVLEKDSPPLTAQLVYNADTGGFRIFSRPANETAWTLHAKGHLFKMAASAVPPAIDPKRLKNRYGQIKTSEEIYRVFKGKGLGYGPFFQGITKLWYKGQNALGKVVSHEQVRSEARKFYFHPTIFDACLQVLLGAMIETDENSAFDLFLPVQVNRIRFFEKPSDSVWCHSKLIRQTPKTIEGDIRVYNSKGLPVLEIQGLVCNSVAGVARPAWENPEKWLYQMNWRYAPLPQDPEPDLDLDIVAKEAEEKYICLSSRLDWYQEYKKHEPAIERLSCLYLMEAFDRLGFPTDSPIRFSIDDIMQKTKIVKTHERALVYLLEKLCVSGYAGKQDGKYYFLKPIGKQGSEKELRRLLEAFPAYYAEISLTRKFGTSIPDLLTGKAHALGLMFPGGSTQLMENIYQDSPSFQLYNSMLAEALEGMISQLPDDRTLNILEIGSGTGGLTTHVLQKLDPELTRYVFTDVTNAFLSKAQRKFSDFSFVEYRILDIETDPMSQEFKPHSFDFILGSDVLHATSDIGKSLAHIKQLLTPRGVLMMLEANPAYNSWSDLVFSFTEGWWKFKDQDVREGYPLMTVKRWREILVANGFSKVKTIPGLENENTSFHTLLMAQGHVIAPVHRDDPLAAAPEHWLVFSDDDIGEQLIKGLSNCCVVRQAEEYRQLSKNRYEIAPGSGKDMEQLLDQALSNKKASRTRILFLWGIKPSSTGSNDDETLKEALANRCLSLFYLARTLSRMDIDLQHLYIVTRGAQAVGRAAIDLKSSPLWGLGRVLLNEMSKVPCKMIDLDPMLSDRDADILRKELVLTDAEQEVVIRNGRRYYPRVENVDIPEKQDPREPFTLKISRQGVIDDLCYTRIEPEGPKPGQMTIKVMAAGFNFRDVMKALGIYPTDGDDYMLLGDECAGIVTELGRDVIGFDIGDEVIAIAPGCFGSHARTIPEFTIKKTEGMTFEQAVTLPISFITAYYCLIDIARLKPGETVLIQAAAGGVGLAAIQVARWVGARVLATASKEKQAFLNALGIENVMDSRTLSFADEVKRLTNGKGVDVVLNSLSKEAINKGLSVLGSHGRFIEIGKRDIYENTRVNLRPFRDNLSFHAVDLSRIMKENPGKIKKMLTLLQKKFNENIFYPLPHRVFPSGRIVEAFRHMARAKHIGKIVVSFYDQVRNIKPMKKTAPCFSPKATYVITGGMGGFGLTISEWLVENGARYLVLNSSSGVLSDRAEKVIEKLEKADAHIMIHKADVAQKDQMAAMFRMISEQMPPLKGIIHGAMVLDDAPLSRMTGHSFNRVINPKVLGAWNLHELTLDMPLDFFIMLSSIASLVGNTGQANYVAANTFLDTLAHYRRQMGLPATSINWGFISQVGYVAEHAEVAEYFHKVGMNEITPKQAMKILGDVIRTNPIQIGAAHINWSRVMQNMGASDRPVLRTSGWMDRIGAADTRFSTESKIKERLEKAAPEEREALLSVYIYDQLFNILGTSSSRIDPEQSLSELGLDSLMAVELKNSMESDLHINLPMYQLMRGPSVEKLTRIISRQLSKSPLKTVPKNKKKKDPWENRIVRLKSAGDRPPMFCIHGGGGDVSIFKHLADSMPPGQPVFGIPSRALISEKEEHNTITGLLDEYTDIIRGYGSGLPIVLTGFSFGGLLALNIASRLEHLGESIGFVAMIDPDLPSSKASGNRRTLYLNLISSMVTTLSARSDDFNASVEILNSDSFTTLVNHLVTSPSEKNTSLLFQWIKDNQLVSSNIPEQEITKFLDLFNKHSQMRAGMKIDCIESDLFIWEVKKKLSGKNPLDTDWKQFTTGACSRQIMDTDHFNILYPPWIKRIADQMGKKITTGMVHE